MKFRPQTDVQVPEIVYIHNYMLHIDLDEFTWPGDSDLNETTELR